MRWLERDQAAADKPDAAEIMLMAMAAKNRNR